jgi:hypothetical protein
MQCEPNGKRKGKNEKKRSDSGEERDTNNPQFFT